MKRLSLVILLLLAISPMAEAIFFRPAKFVVGGVTGTPVPGRNTKVSLNLVRDTAIPPYALVTEAIGGNFGFNVFNLDINPDPDPLAYDTWRGAGDAVRVYVDPRLNAGFLSDPKTHPTTNAGFDNILEDLVVRDSVPVYGGPQLSIEAFLEGYYDPSTGTQAPAILKVEARTGSGGPETATTTVESTWIRVDENGFGHNGFPSESIAQRNYYFVVTHVLTTTEAPVQHLPIITSITVSYGRDGFGVDHHVAISISDTTSLIYNAAYTPSGVTLEAMLPSAARRLLRTGDINGDRLVNTVDFAIWRGYYDASGFDPVADLQGDGDVDTVDFAFWRGEYDRLPSRDQCYVP